MRGLLVLACLLLAARVEANPIGRDDVTTALAQLEVQTEPFGLSAKVDLPKLGLLKGDVIRTINGFVPVAASDLDKPVLERASVIHLEVIRAGKPVSLKLALRPFAVEVSRDRDQLTDTIAFLRGASVPRVQPVKAGLVVIERGLFGHDGPTVGDVLRKIDGKPVTTAEQLAAALEAALTKTKVVLDVERASQPFTVTVLIITSASDPQVVAQLDKIEKVSDTSYKVPRKLSELITKNPMVFSKGARIVPAMKDGKPEGFKLYAIRPTSIYAKVGLQNGDTLLTLNGMSLASMDKALEAFKKASTASKFVVELRRRGKPLTLEWTLK